MTNKTICIVLTEEGKEFSDEGLDYIAKKLEIPKKNLVFMMGKVYNTPSTLATAIKTKPMSCIAISTDKDVITVKPIVSTAHNSLIKSLEEHPNENAWDIALKCIPKTA